MRLDLNFSGSNQDNQALIQHERTAQLTYKSKTENIASLSFTKTHYVKASGCMYWYHLQHDNHQTDKPKLIWSTTNALKRTLKQNREEI